MSVIWTASSGVPFRVSQKKRSDGTAVVLYGRRGKAALLAQPLLKDRDLSVLRMVLMFGFVEPSQEAQPLDSATDKACSRLG
jgi:hypothetical protein